MCDLNQNIYQLKSSLSPLQSKTMDHFSHFLKKQTLSHSNLSFVKPIISLLISIFVGFDQRKQRMLMTSLMSESQMWCFSQKNENFIFRLGNAFFCHFHLICNFLKSMRIIHWINLITLLCAITSKVHYGIELVKDQMTKLITVTYTEFVEHKSPCRALAKSHSQLQQISV